MRRLVLAPLFLSATLLPGCGYTAYVRNTTDRPVHVQMIRRDGLNPDWVLATARADPGARVRLGPATVGGGKVVLEAGERTSERLPAVLRLHAGTKSFSLGYGPDGGTLVLSPADEP